MQFNQQKLLFDESQTVHHLRFDKYSIPTDYYSNGYTIFNNIKSPEEANKIIEQFIGNLESSRIPLFQTLHKRIQLAKADLIPVCDDVVESSYQVLHFDMGHPFIDTGELQMMVTNVGIYAPIDKPACTAKTRVVNLHGLIGDLWGNQQEIEDRIVQYVNKYGDGWADVNTGRIACFARIVDAVSGTVELKDHKDKTVGQWFRDEKKLDADECLKNEHSFYALRRINLSRYEKQIQLKPGQLLIIDNLRTIHGRIGKRKAKEIYNFMYGVKQVFPDEISSYRKFLSSYTTSSS